MTFKSIHSLKFNKAIRCVITMALTVVMMLALVPVFSFEAYATYETKYGTVTIDSGYLNVRASAGTGGTAIGQLKNGTNVTIIGEESDSAGTIWYKINYVSTSGDFGYISSDFVVLYTPENPDVNPDDGDEEDEIPDGPTIVITDFEAWMEEQGFPETYKPGLRKLHEKYPEWIFKADHIAYSWDTVVTAQMRLKASLVEDDFPASWKSTQDGAYDWESGEWIPLDGTRWVQASREIIEFYLDPRNFLDSSTVFQFLEQSFDPEVHTLEIVQTMLYGTFMSGKLPDEDASYARVIYEVSKENNVNPCVIASMIIIEQGATGSALCSGKYPGYEGYYNYFNYGAYGANPVVAGLSYAKEEGWDTARKSITAGIEKFADGYIAIGQSTLYYKRFDFVGDPFSHQYSQSIYSPKVEGERAARGYTEDMRHAALTFTIPVFMGMPETACTKPTSNAPPYIKLSTLSVKGAALYPRFQPDILNYTITVSPDTSSVDITAVTMDKAASVSGAGTVELSGDITAVTITVTAVNGETRNYTVTIVKEEPQIVTPEFSDNYVMLGNYIIVPLGTTAETLASNLLTSGIAVITSSDGSDKAADDILKSGDNVLIFNKNNEYFDLCFICIKGDATGDGKINAYDLIRFKKYLSGNDVVFYEAAADVTGDGEVNALDLIRLKKFLSGADVGLD